MLTMAWMRARQGAAVEAEAGAQVRKGGGALQPEHRDARRPARARGAGRCAPPRRLGCQGGARSLDIVLGSAVKPGAEQPACRKQMAAPSCMAAAQGAQAGPCGGGAPQVMRFWGKAERVVAFKRQRAVEALKKEAMDKHLSFLLGQTQRYSSLLAQRLAPGSEDASPHARSLPAAGGSRAGAAASEGAAPGQETGAEAPDLLAGADHGAGSEAVAAAGSDERNGGAHAGPDAAELEESRGHGDDEAEAEVEEEEEDDEATLEEEEVCASC